MLTMLNAYATNIFSQNARVSVDMQNATVREVVSEIERQGGINFLFNDNLAGLNQRVNVSFTDQPIKNVLAAALSQADMTYEEIKDDFVVLLHKLDFDNQQENTVTGRVTDAETGEGLPGVSIVILGTTTGVTTDINGDYEIVIPDEDPVLQFSYVGYQTEQIAVEEQNTINVSLIEDIAALDEVVVIGYGTARRRDLTGSIVTGDIDAIMDQPNVSLVEGLQGSVPGLNIAQINRAGQNPNISVRGQATLSGELDPLIVLDGVIFRGELIDINPSDVKSVDILKDASATAIYGSQASNGVILIATTSGDGEPSVKYSGRFSFQRPHNELRPEVDPDAFMLKTELSDIEASRTEESGYLQRNPEWVESANFKTNHQANQYILGRTFDWYDHSTTDNPYTNSHNISLSNSIQDNSYFVSIGYTGQDGHMLDESYERINGRINLSSSITNWLDLDIQSFLSSSEWGPQTYSPNDRFRDPFATPRDENGELVERPLGEGINELIVAQSDILDKRLNLGGNISGTVYLPVEGLNYQMRFGNNYLTTRNNYFGSHGSNFQGSGYKRNDGEYNLSLDNILSYNNSFNEIHEVDITLLYGFEERNYEFTRADGSIFANHVLGYNRLQAADAEQQRVSSGGWQESSLYSMGRISYKLQNRYLVNATIRRDGFSGFSDKNKFGNFPSIAVGWVISEESFLKNSINGFMDWLKLRASYGATGNRTIGRYETLAQVSGAFGYVTSDGSSLYSQWISGLESPDLKWETTTGFNFGVDFRLFDSRISGSIDYYNNNTTDLLYNVDIPGLSRFLTFPDNLGKIHNQGIDFNISSINIKTSDLTWSSNFTFSRNRDVIKELLGFDLDGDGREDDLISEGLFIDESLGTIYDYEIDGFWQLDDDIPPGYAFGSYKVIDLNDDGIYNADDKTIIGNSRPSYRFSINNVINYKNWTLRVFINSVQGGNNWYLGEDDMYNFSIFNTESHFNHSFPKGIDFWTPENPNAKYQRPGIKGSWGINGQQYTPRSFIRLRDLSISYRFDSGFTNFVKDMRIIFSGRNLLTLTNWPGWDPETGEGVTRWGRPVMESYSLGIDVTF